MRCVLPAILFSALIGAQPLPQGNAVTGIQGIDSKSLINLGMPQIHIHTLMHGSCKGQPDHVYGNSGNTYYACISEQDVCTDAKAHKGVGVPKALITQYSQVKALQEAEREKQRAEFERERPERERRQAEFDQRIAELRANRGNSATKAPTPTVIRSTAKRATAVPLADEKLEGIEVGATLTAVIERLGNPTFRIAGQTESLTYQLASGGTARLEFEGGILKRFERAEP